MEHFTSRRIGKSGLLCDLLASDCGGMDTGDTKDPLYLKLKDNPRVLVSPHISYNTKLSIQTGIDVMIDNVEAWINGKPQNVVEE